MRQIFRGVSCRLPRKVPKVDQVSLAAIANEQVVQSEGRESDGPGPSISSSRVVLFTALGVEAFFFLVIRFPGAMQFDGFAFSDTGANLTAHYLVAHGYRPVLDFTYHYGLLSLLAADLWFRAFGGTPGACEAAVVFADLFLIWALVRFIISLRLRSPGLLIVVSTLPLTVPYSTLNIAHILEPVLLYNALAAQAAGHRRSALALATACVFVKPSMAYAYGLVLIALSVKERLQEDRELVRDCSLEFYPAALTGLGVFAILALYFGLVPLLRSVIPSEGARAYAANHFGFFHGTGQLFWAPDNASASYYATNTVGPWLAGTLVLVAFAMFSVNKLIAPSERSGLDLRTAEIVVTCAALHVAFIVFFFGNSYSWSYYFYLLVFGLAAASQLFPAWQTLICFLALAFPLVKINKFALSHIALPKLPFAISQNLAGSEPRSPREVEFTYQLWFTSAPTAETAGLWASPQERTEWMKVLSLIKGQRTAVLDRFGCVELLFPEFAPPVTLYMVPGAPTAEMVARKVSQLESVSRIVMPCWESGLLDSWPPIGNVVREHFADLWQGNFFVVYQRVEPANRIWRTVP
jgi:hypothetical protein